MRHIEVSCRQSALCKSMPSNRQRLLTIELEEPRVVVAARVSIADHGDDVVIRAADDFNDACSACQRVALTLAYADVARLHGIDPRDFNVRFEGSIVGRRGRLVDVEYLELNKSALEHREADIILKQDDRILSHEPDTLIGDLHMLLAGWRS